MKINAVIKAGFLMGIIMLGNQLYAQDNQDGFNNKTKIIAQNPEEGDIVAHAIMDLISKNKLLSKYDIGISVKNGVVTYIGTVDSNTQAELLAEYAESVVGVADVDMSQLKIKKSEHILSDAIITAKIKGLFIREKLFGEKDIATINTSVETKDGVVYLSGNVDQQEQIDNAIEIIKRNLPEVKRVEYSIRKGS